MKSGFITTVFSVGILSLIGQTCHAAPYGSGFYGEIQASVTHENNVSRASTNPDIVSDVISALSAGGGYTTKFGNAAELLLTGYITVNHHEDWRALDHRAAALGADLVVRSGRGYNAPWFQVRTTVTRLDYADSAVRDGYLFSAGASISWRLTPKTVTQLGLRHDDLVLVKNRAQKTLGTAFDTASSEAYVQASHALTHAIFAYAEYGYRRGGFTSSASGSPIAALAYESETVDGAFDTCSTPPCNERYAYRQVANVQAVTVGFIFPLRGLDVDLSARYYDAKGDNGLSYRNRFAQAALIWNF